MARAGYVKNPTMWLLLQFSSFMQFFLSWMAALPLVELVSFTLKILHENKVDFIRAPYLAAPQVLGLLFFLSKEKR